jgi:hypothetical protein
MFSTPWILFSSGPARRAVSKAMISPRVPGEFPAPDTLSENIAGLAVQKIGRLEDRAGT